MEMKDDYNLANRYKVVRKRLDVLGYKQSLSIDALPLVETLLADLIQTTDSLKHFKTIAQDNIEVCSELQLAVDPYKCDNAKLVQENNRLHAELFETKETYSKQVSNLKKQIRKLENDNVDLQLRLSKNIQRIKEVEAETAKKSRRILELQGKCVKPTISNVSLGTKSRKVFPFKKSVLEFEPLQNNELIQTPLPSTRNTEPYIIDFVQMADQRMNCLNQEVIKLRHELSAQTDNINGLNNQLIVKEKEILRLRKMLEGGRPYSAVTTDCYCKKSDKLNGIRNGECNEIDVLRRTKIDLEQQLKEAINKQHDAMAQAVKLAERNEELEKELKDLDHLALAVEADCTSAVKEKDKKVQKLQGKIDETNTQVCVLENELIIARKEMQELRADLESAKSEKRSIQRILESTLDEKKQLTDRINELTLIEQKSKCECEKLKQDNTNQKKKIQELEAANKKLKENVKEKPKEIPKSNCREDNKIAKKKPLARSQPISKSPGRKDQNRIQTGGLSSRDCACTTDDQQSELRSLEIERDFYRNEYNKFKEQYTKETCFDNVTSRDQSHDLKKQVLEKEREIAELLREKKELCREKMDLEIQLQSLKPTQRTSCSVCNPCVQATHNTCFGNKDCLSLKTKLERAERARDLAKSDVERLIQERDALRERIKMTTEAHQSEQRRLKKCVNEVETRLKNLESDRKELVIVQGTQRATVISLEAKLVDAQDELREKRSELMEIKTQYSQLRAKHDQSDHTICDLQGQLAHAQSELSRTLDRNKSLEHQQFHLDNQTKELKQEINTLRCNISQLERQKEQLELELEGRIHKISSLENELMCSQQQTIDNQRKIHHLEQQNQMCLDQKAEQERHIKNLQCEISNMQRQLMSASMDKENLCAENRRLQEDLATMTSELRALQRELDSARCESVDLKRQLQTYVSEVRRFEELLDRKECERTDMLEHFKSLSMEATVLENNNHSLESEAAKAKGALQAANEQISDLDRQLSHKDGMIRGYESQISDMTQTIANLETQLRQQNEQRQRAETDLNAVKNLCIMLERQKDGLLQQIKDKDEMKAQYETQIARLQADCAAQCDQMGRDHAAVDRLEDLLARSRQETMEAQTMKQKLENELCRLEQKNGELQTKLSAEKEEMRRCQMQMSEYDRQMEELKRQMTNERFDRALRDEEKRRSPNSTPDRIEVMSRDDQCKLQCLKKLLPHCEAGLIESPCLQAAILNFIKTHNIQIEIFELTPNSRAHCKNGSSTCHKLIKCGASSNKKKVNFGAQCGNGNVSHESPAKCPQSNANRNPKVVNSVTYVCEDEFDRNLNSGHSKPSFSQVDRLNQSQKLDNPTRESLDKRKKSDCACQASNYNYASTLPVPNAPPCPYPSTPPCPYPSTPNNTLENTIRPSGFGEISSLRQDTCPERPSARTTPNPVRDPSRLRVPELSRTRTVTPSSIYREDTIGPATSNELNVNNGVSEALKAPPKQKPEAACECLFNKLTQKSPQHLEFFNKVVQRFEHLMEVEEKLQKKKQSEETSIIDEIISKLTFIMQDTVEQYNLSGDIRKAQSLRGRNENMNIEEFRPRSASSRRGSPIAASNADNVSFNLVDPDNVTVARTRDQIRPVPSKVRPDPGTEFLSLQSNTKSSRFGDGMRDRSQAAVSGSEASDSDEKIVTPPMPQRIWQSSPKRKHIRSKSKQDIPSRPKPSEISRSNFGGGPSDPPEINVIHPTNEGRSEMTFAESTPSYPAQIQQQFPSQRIEGDMMSQPGPARPQQTDVCPVRENTIDESFSWINMDSTYQPEGQNYQPQMDQTFASPRQPEYVGGPIPQPVSEGNRVQMYPNYQCNMTYPDSGVFQEQVRGNEEFSRVVYIPCPARNYPPEQVPCYSADYVVDSAATSYMELPPARNVVVQNNVSQINQTTATQCEPDSMREDSDKNIQTCEYEDLCTDECAIPKEDPNKDIPTCEYEDLCTDKISVSKEDPDKDIQPCEYADLCTDICAVSKEDPDKDIPSCEYQDLCTDTCAVSKPSKKSRVPVLQSRQRSSPRLSFADETTNSPGTSTDEIANRTGNKSQVKNGKDELNIEYLNKEKEKKRRERREKRLEGSGGNRRRVTIETPTRDRSPSMIPLNKSASRFSQDRKKRSK